MDGDDAVVPHLSTPVARRDPEVPPLRGIRVLDLTTVWSGPFLTALLADLGAEVIRVETPRVFPPTTKGYVPRPEKNMVLGALARMYGPLAPGREDRPYNRHAMNNSLARGKRSCTLDVRDPEQRELFMRLVAVSDVFVENLKASTLHQLGIHETELLEANPRMIVLRLPRPACPATGRTTPASAASSTGSPVWLHCSGTAARRSWSRRRPCTWTASPGPRARSRRSPRSTTAPRPDAVR